MVSSPRDPDAASEYGHFAHIGTLEPPWFGLTAWVMRKLAISIVLSLAGKGWTLCGLLLRLASDNLDLFGIHLQGVVHLELDVLDHECPDLVAESVHVEVTFKCHPGLDFVTENLGDVLIEVGHNTHCQLRLNSPRADEVVEGVCESEADAGAQFSMLGY